MFKHPAYKNHKNHKNHKKHLKTKQLAKIYWLEKKINSNKIDYYLLIK